MTERSNEAPKAEAQPEQQPQQPAPPHDEDPSAGLQGFSIGES